jgi:hypothetical protein
MYSDAGRVRDDQNLSRTSEWKEVNSMARSGKHSSGRGRSATTGKFVKLSYAKSHPKTTVVEKTSGSSSKK